MQKLTNKEEEINKDIDNAIKAIAIEAGIDMVLDYRVMYFGGIDITDKSVRVATFHKNTMKALGEFIGACGFSKSNEVSPEVFHKRIEHGKNMSFAEMYFKDIKKA